MEQASTESQSLIMPANLHILCGPEGSGKTRRLMERGRQVAFGSTLWIGPDADALEAVRQRWPEGRASSFLPRLVTFQDLADEIIRCQDPGARSMADSQRRLLLDTLIQELRQAGGLSHFEAVIE